MKTIFIVLLAALTLTGFDLAQERTITGKVMSAEDGSAMPGVTVALKGTTKGTVTDHHGKYSLKVPTSGGTLLFSFIGYVTKEIRIGKFNIIHVQMQTDVTTLEEVVQDSRPKGR